MSVVKDEILLIIFKAVESCSTEMQSFVNSKVEIQLWPVITWDVVCKLLYYF